ncbi:MAG: SPOR domain-containing protein [Gammaproteobacteria bacterium]|jgi:DedD protein|nr:SPOR domain-containing protein [Gammaproteobacteria bacterium]
MSEQPPNRSLRLRHRIVGAAVLAALIAIFVPAVLEFDRSTETGITTSNIPERPADLRVEEIPLLPPAAGPVVSGNRAPAGTEPQATGGEAAEVAPGADASATAEAPAASTARAWVVRVGSFSSNDNAVALRDRLRAAGFDAFVDKAAVDGATMFRVHVGPEIDRARGDALRDRLAREMKLDGLVVGYE